MWFRKKLRALGAPHSHFLDPPLGGGGGGGGGDIWDLTHKEGWGGGASGTSGDGGRICAEYVQPGVRREGLTHREGEGGHLGPAEMEG